MASWANRAKRARIATQAATTSADTAVGRGRSQRSKSPVASSDGRTRSDRAVDGDALLGVLFPNGIPAKEEVIRAVNSWLDEAERLTQLK